MNAYEVIALIVAASIIVATVLHARDGQGIR